eukprot:TRINITY_DN4447_c0_g1_i1.p1 TRINITY_DN4447_c0_g1~~TRINITY_DN4447_c0_g1_i1.p1  ORF type:complete len:132 (+),score=8.97 TRINITY_DN4447_c0_g1_i1:137-532(+)
MFRILQTTQARCCASSSSSINFANAIRARSTAPTPRLLGLLRYEYVDNMLERRQPHRDAHLQYAQEQVAKGHMLLGGALADPVDTGIIVCSSVETATAFAESDPYVHSGLVKDYSVREWLVVAGSMYDDIN